VAIAVGVYLLGFGMLVGMALDRMRFDGQRTAVLTHYEQALRDWNTYRMAFEKDAAVIRREPQTSASLVLGDSDLLDARIVAR
jgi:hypothetical protein